MTGYSVFFVLPAGANFYNNLLLFEVAEGEGSIAISAHISILDSVEGGTSMGLTVSLLGRERGEGIANPTDKILEVKDLMKGGHRLKAISPLIYIQGPTQ